MSVTKPRKVISEKKRKTYLRMLRSIIIATIIVVVILTILQLLGINVSSMLAGVGIASIIIGFALQDAMKDIFRGLEIVADDYYDIGDVIKFGDNVGQVLSINLRTTKIQDINSMNIVSIANRNIDKVEVLTGYIYLPIPLPLRIKPTAADALMAEIVKSITEIPTITSVINQGVTAITNSSLNYQLQITCEPMQILETRRRALGRATATLAAHKILLPYTELNLHGIKIS
ncbi:mechanosensitive ion channel [Candidatus Saccharibacteria bacterium]|nr:mechanosensitive ion channel [Candidatus Saccharibacteria bacterium]MBQ6321064.1 mechanosensitive ion channel [Candidatus Saccharibacteria bacterium]